MHVCTHRGFVERQSAPADVGVRDVKLAVELLVRLVLRLRQVLPDVDAEQDEDHDEDGERVWPHPHLYNKNTSQCQHAPGDTQTETGSECSATSNVCAIQSLTGSLNDCG